MSIPTSIPYIILLVWYRNNSDAKGYCNNFVSWSFLFDFFLYHNSKLCLRTVRHQDKTNLLHKNHRKESSSQNIFGSQKRQIKSDDTNWQTCIQRTIKHTQRRQTVKFPYLLPKIVHFIVSYVFAIPARGPDCDDNLKLIFCQWLRFRFWDLYFISIRSVLRLILSVRQTICLSFGGVFVLACSILKKGLK